MRIIVTIFLLLGWSVLGTAQSAASSKGQDKVNVYRNYDKSKQLTTTQTETMLIHGPHLHSGGRFQTGSGLTMRAFYSYPGETPVKPESVTLWFFSSENFDAFKDERDLTIKADDEVFRLGKMDYGHPPDRHSHFESLSMSIPAEVFIRIANAKNVQVRLGEDEFDLNKQQLRNLQGLAAAMIQ